MQYVSLPRAVVPGENRSMFFRAQQMNAETYPLGQTFFKTRHPLAELVAVIVSLQH